MKLMQEKQRPVGVGFFFSLGHSTIVVVLTVIIAITALGLKNFTGLENFDRGRSTLRHRACRWHG